MLNEAVSPKEIDDDFGRFGSDNVSYRKLAYFFALNSITLNKGYLPIHDIVNNFFLLRASLFQINAGGFNVFMSHDVRQKRDIMIVFQEIFCEPMPEGMGIDHVRINMIAQGYFFELSGNPPRGDGIPVFI